MKYKHLSYSDRQEMEKLYLQGWHMNDIAAKLGVSLATVYHERARGDTGKMDKNGRGGYRKKCKMQELLHPGNRRPDRPVEYRGGGAACFATRRMAGHWARGCAKPMRRRRLEQRLFC